MAYGNIIGQSFETSPVLDNYFTKDETLTSNTASLYGLSSSAVPDDVLAKARELITTAQSTANNIKTDLRYVEIGTADLSGMEHDQSFSISLSKSVDTLDSFIIIGNNMLMAGDYNSDIVFLDLETNISNSDPSFVSATIGNKKIRPSSMLLRLDFGEDRAFSIAEIVSRYGTGATTTTDTNVGNTYLVNASSIKNSISCRINSGIYEYPVKSGTIKVYGRIKQ